MMVLSAFLVAALFMVVLAKNPIFAFFTAPIAFLVTARFSYMIITDYLKLKRAIIKPILDRTEIIEQLQCFKSPIIKLVYVQKLQNNSVQATGNWPEGKLPHAEIEAYALLAQLEEQWLGFDR